jgi:hypothetical protein
MQVILLNSIIFRILPISLEFTNQVYHREVFQNPYKWSDKHSPEEDLVYKAKARHCIRRQHFFDKRFPNISGVRSAMAGETRLQAKTE